MSKLLLYHVGFYEIKKPDLKYGRKNADFGQGFYLSDNLEFVLKWAVQRDDKDTYLNKYELDLSDLNVKTFERTVEWYEYINNNRNSYEDYLKEDVIIGPIANDILFDTLGITTSGILEKDKAYRLLNIFKTYNQIVIKTEKANDKLRFIESVILRKEELLRLKKNMKKEEKKFQKLFFKEFKKL